MYNMYKPCSISCSSGWTSFTKVTVLWIINSANFSVLNCYIDDVSAQLHCVAPLLRDVTYKHKMLVPLAS